MRKPEPAHVVREVCRIMGISYPDLIGNARRGERRTITKAIAVNILHEHYEFSYPECTKPLGYASHSAPVTANAKLMRGLYDDHPMILATMHRTIGGIRAATVESVTRIYADS